MMVDDVAVWNGVSVNLSSNEVTAFGRTIKLRGRSAELLYLIMRQAPNIARKNFLLERMDPLGQLNDPKFIDVHVHHLRKATESLPFNVKTIWGQGYRIEAA